MSHKKGEGLKSFNKGFTVPVTYIIIFFVVVLAAILPITGITGKVSDAGGKLTFDDTALQFDLMAEEQVTPVSAPWILMKTLRSGYITSAGMDGGRLRLTIDDSYEDDALHLDIWLGEDDCPEDAEILYKERRILSLKVTNFETV